MNLKTIQDHIEEAATKEAKQKLSAEINHFRNTLDSMVACLIGSVKINDKQEFFQVLANIETAFAPFVTEKAKDDATKAFLQKVEQTAEAVEELRNLLPPQ